MQVLVAFVALLLVTACSQSDRERELAECLDIYRTTYVTGRVRDCLIQRYGWSAEAADEAERERVGNVHPDSARLSDSGRMGDSAH